MIGRLELNLSMIKHDQRLFCMIRRFWCKPVTIGWPRMVLGLIETLYSYWNSIFWDSGAYIALIDEPFTMLESWWCLGGVERLQERFQRTFVRILELFIERLLYKVWVVSFSCIDFVLFSHSEASMPRGGRFEVDPRICIMFLILFLLSSCCTMWYRILHNRYMGQTLGAS